MILSFLFMFELIIICSFVSHHHPIASCAMFSSFQRFININNCVVRHVPSQQNQSCISIHPLAFIPHTNQPQHTTVTAIPFQHHFHSSNTQRSVFFFLVHLRIQPHGLPQIHEHVHHLRERHIGGKASGRIAQVVAGSIGGGTIVGGSTVVVVDVIHVSSSSSATAPPPRRKDDVDNVVHVQGHGGRSGRAVIGTATDVVVVIVIILCIRRMLEPRFAGVFPPGEACRFVVVVEVERNECERDGEGNVKVFFFQFVPMHSTHHD